MIAVNALYVAAEFALVAVPRPRIAQAAREGNLHAAALQKILEDPARLDHHIAACQIGITLASLLSGSYGQATLSPILTPFFARAFSLDPIGAFSASTATVLLLLTSAQVILGELVPKNLALRYTVKVALLTSSPIRFSTALYRPFIALLNGSGLLLLKPFGIATHGHQHIHGPDEIEFLLGESKKTGTLTPEVHNRLRRGLHLSQRTVHELMVPRRELDAIEVSTPMEEVILRLRKSPYSRLPVYRETLDAVFGIISSKDLVSIFAQQRDLPSLESLVQPLPFVPESIPADRLVKYLQEKQTSLAIVVDEYGGVQGLISIEDVLVELLGDLGDELKDPSEVPETLEDGSTKLSGTMTLTDAEPWLGCRWHGVSTSIGGHVIERLGRLPTTGEEHVIDGVHLKILEMGPTMIRWLLIQKRDPS